ncbi:MAG TPA: outer membrane beta-barrel protein [Candidatus Acidoferrales bacterium]|nr:outer membrane beta-barrel protein [Candidatus Acidoferrales bacterium]
MSGKRVFIATVAALALLTTLAAAQDEKNEVGGTVGRTFVSDQGIKLNIADPTIHSGKGVTLEGFFAHRFLVTPIYSIAGEVPVAYNVDEDLVAGQIGNSVPADYKALFVTPAARVNLFPTTAVSPWVSFGAGFGHFSEGKTLAFGGANPGKSTTNFVLEGGLGLDVRVWSRLSIRGQVRDFWSGEPDFPQAPTGKSRQHNFFVSGGAFWRF